MGCACSFFSTWRAKRVRYDEIAPKLRTGDIFLFKGASFQSFEVQLGTMSPFSHVGMVDRCEHMDQNGGTLYLWHSPAQTLAFSADRITHETKAGPQLNRLKATLRAADGTVYVRRLVRRKSRRRRQRRKGDRYELDDRNDDDTPLLGDPCGTPLMDYMRRTAPKTYETSFKELLLSAYDGAGGQNRENLDSYFCSELVAQTYIVMGLMHSEEPSNEYVPCDFNRDLVLRGGYRLGKLVRVDL